MKKGLEVSGWILFMGGLGVWCIKAIINGELVDIFTSLAWLVGCFLIIIAQIIKSQ